MRVEFLVSSMDWETRPLAESYDPTVAIRVDVCRGEVQGYVRDKYNTYAIVLTDKNQLKEVLLSNLTVIK